MRARYARPAGWRSLPGVPTPDDAPAALAALGPQIDDPIGGADHVEIVLDDEQRVPGIDEPSKRAQQFRDIVEMQAGRRLIEQEQGAAAGAVVAGGARTFAWPAASGAALSAKCPASFRRCASPPDSVGTG